MRIADTPVETDCCPLRIHPQQIVLDLMSSTGARQGCARIGIMYGP